MTYKGEGLYLPLFLDGMIWYDKDGGFAKWTKATVCKTVILGSNPRAAYFKKIQVANRREFIRIENQEQTENISEMTCVLFPFIRAYSCKFVAER